MIIPINYTKATSVFLLNSILVHILILLFTITLLLFVGYINYLVFGQIFFIYVLGTLFIIALNLYNTYEKWYINLFYSILDILLELFDDPLQAGEGISIGIEDLEPEGNKGPEGDPNGPKGDPEGPEGDPEGDSNDPKGDPEGSEGDPEGDSGDPEEDPEDSEKKDKKRKRSVDSEDDSEEDDNKPKKSKVDKGKGRADPDDISDDDHGKYGYRDPINSDDEQSFYEDQHSDEDDDNAYLAESLDRREELQKNLEGASPEEKERILNEINVLTDLINNLLN